MSEKFAILRKESAGGYSTRGPTAKEMSFAEARDEIARLKSLYPHQDFVMMGEVGEAKRTVRVTVKIEAPELPGMAKKRRRIPQLEGNVVSLHDQPKHRAQNVG
jgi:hypothetical protein